MKTSRNTNRTNQTNRKNNNGNHNNSADNMRKPLQKYMQEKLAITVIVIMLALFALVLVLYNLVDEKNEEYTKVVLSQHSSYDSRTIPYRRGDITDRNGTFLATSEKVYNLIIDPRQIYDGEAESKVDYLNPTVDALVQCFGYDRAELLAAIQEKKNTAYLRYDRRLSYDQKVAFETLKDETNKAFKDAKSENRVYGVWFEDEYKRLYPYSALACNVIGFSGSDSSEGTGGLEQFYNSTLIGTNGREYGYLNDDSNMETVIKMATNGNTVVSTLDVNIQNMVEKQIDAFQAETGSKQMGIVVMDPRNGEILAMASEKRYDLNNPRDLSGYYTPEEIEAMDADAQAKAWNQMWRNFCVSDTYEPGSPAKIFTVSAGLEDALVSPSSHFFCDGFQHVVDRNIKCTAYSKGGHGDLDLAETLIVSCNDAMMQIAELEGKTRFSKYSSMFGFGSKTGIDLPGEADAATLVYTARNMGPSELATSSFGQGFNCTMVQMAAAFSSVINGGSYYEPHVAKQILNEQGAVVKKLDPVLVRETVSENTSNFINNALMRTVDEGTGKAAKVPGYKVGGKTGTAEKLPRGNDKYVVSFCGFAPADDPQVLVYVVIDEPNVALASSSLASKVFSNVMQDILPYMNIFPTVDLPETPEELQGQETQPEGITDNTGNPDETGEDPNGGTEGETEPESRVYETDEVVAEGGLGLGGETAGSGETTGSGETDESGEGETVNGPAGQNVPEPTSAVEKETTKAGPGLETTEGQPGN